MLEYKNKILNRGRYIIMEMHGALAEKKLFIFDMDGTVYLGEKAFDGAIDFIKNLRAAGRKILFFTNNASNIPEFYLSRLSRMGFEPTRDEIMTSADVTILYLNKFRQGKRVYLVGTDELRRQFAAGGIPLIGDDAESADIVITSFDLTLTYRKLERACTFIRGGAEYFSTHPDFNCPTENGFIPDSGAISAFVTAATGVKPVYFGKPYSQTVDMICEKTGFSKEQMCVFGDRLYTDIAMGKRHGITSVLVLSGETCKEDADSAEECDRPDFVFPSLGDVNIYSFGS